MAPGSLNEFQPPSNPIGSLGSDVQEIDIPEGIQLASSAEVQLLTVSFNGMTLTKNLTTPPKNK
jgi:hypothetical protein